MSPSIPLQCLTVCLFPPQGLQYFNSKLKVLERRQQQVKELRVKHEALWEELEDTKARLMMDPRKWIGECKYLLLSNMGAEQVVFVLGDLNEVLAWD